MPKFRFRWKDPDWYNFPGIYVEGQKPEFNRQLTDEEWELVGENGLGEYVTIEYDSDTKTLIVNPKRK